MNSSHIYINPQGVPCAPTMDVPPIEMKFAHESEEHAMLVYLQRVKLAAIPIREEDREYMMPQNAESDTFIFVGPYEFEIEKLKEDKDGFNLITNVARIIRPSEPKADPKEKELYSIKGIQWSERMYDGMEYFYWAENPIAAYEVTQHAKNSHSYTIDGDCYGCLSIEEGMQKCADHFNSKLKLCLNREIMKDDAKPNQPGYKYARRDPSETREDAIEYLKSQGLNADEVIANGLARIKETEERIKNGIMKHPTDEEIEKESAKYVNESDITMFDGQDELLIAQHHFWTGAKWARDQQPKLKTLEEWGWNLVAENLDNWFDCVTPIGRWEVIDTESIPSDVPWRFAWRDKGYGSQYWQKCDSIDHGKQLAQADCERRINDFVSSSTWCAAIEVEKELHALRIQKEIDRQEIETLKSKAYALDTLWDPIVDYAQSHKIDGLRLGDSISAFVLKLLKERTI